MAAQMRPAKKVLFMNIEEKAKAYDEAVENDGMVYKIWYRTVGDENGLVRYEVVTLEEWEWEKHGCKNNEEWRKHLNRSLWADYRCGLDFNNKKQEV